MRTRDVNLNRQRRDMILKAAAECFVKQGFHATSMKDVCAAAKLSPGTVYHYVRSKTDIIRGIIEDEQSITADLLQPLGEADDFFVAFYGALDAMAAMVKAEDLRLAAEIAAETLRQPDLHALSRSATSEALDGLAAAIARSQERGQIDRSLAPQKAAAALVALIDGLLWQATLFGVERMAAELPFVKQAVARMLIEPEKAR
jgi:AcrR family transcriptional regulator